MHGSGEHVGDVVRDGDEARIGQGSVGVRVRGVAAGPGAEAVGGVGRVEPFGEREVGGAVEVRLVCGGCVEELA